MADTEDSNGNNRGQTRTNRRLDPEERDIETRRSMRKRRGRTGETFWYTIVGYVFITSISIGLLVYNFGYTEYLSSADAVFLVFGLIAFSVVPYPAIVLDSAYLRSVNSEWTPNWRWYAGLGTALPIGVGVLTVPFVTWIEVIGLSLLTFLPVTTVLCIHYLLSRYRFAKVS